MRYSIKYMTLICLTMLIHGRMAGQPDSFVDYFQVSKINSHIYLNWQLSLGNTCNGITINRSTDSIHFNRIGLIPGICGSPTDVARYHHIDSEPVLNRRNFYQLEFGGEGVSEIIGIDVVDLSDQAYQIWPNPSGDKTNIFFENDEGRVNVLHIYTPVGVSLHTQSTDSDFFHLDASALPDGIYIFTIAQVGAQPGLTGTLLVQH